MDLMFGTFHDPGHMPERYGIQADVSHNYVVQMVDPLLPRRARKALQDRLRARRLEKQAAPEVQGGEALHHSRA